MIIEYSDEAEFPSVKIVTLVRGKNCVQRFSSYFIILTKQFAPIPAQFILISVSQWCRNYTRGMTNWQHQGNALLVLTKGQQI